MNRQKVSSSERMCAKKLPRKATAANNTTGTGNKKKAKPSDEMKSIMKDWHRPVYHKSSFSFSPDTKVTNNVKNHPEATNQTMCRICQSMDDSLKNQQVTPCGCTGSLQYVHMDCLRQWRLTQRAKGVDVSTCELCKKPYNIQLLGNSNVESDALVKMQNDLKQLVRSGIYLMLLVKSWKQEMADHNQRQVLPQENSGAGHCAPIRICSSSTGQPIRVGCGDGDGVLQNIEQTVYRTMNEYDLTPQSTSSNNSQTCHSVVNSNGPNITASADCSNTSNNPVTMKLSNPPHETARMRRRK